MADNTIPARVRVLGVLQFHVGLANGLHCRDLSTQTGISERDCRSAITSLREDGVGVCGTPETGYFIAKNEVELEEYCLKFLRARAMHSLSLISRLTNTALPDLLGQGKLKT